MQWACLGGGGLLCAPPAATTNHLGLRRAVSPPKLNRQRAPQQHVLPSTSSGVPPCAGSGHGKYAAAAQKASVRLSTRRHQASAAARKPVTAQRTAGKRKRRTACMHRDASTQLQRQPGGRTGRTARQSCRPAAARPNGSPPKARVRQPQPSGPPVRTRRQPARHSPAPPAAAHGAAVRGPPATAQTRPAPQQAQRRLQPRRAVCRRRLSGAPAVVAGAVAAAAAAAAAASAAESESQSQKQRPQESQPPPRLLPRHPRRCPAGKRRVGCGSGRARAHVGGAASAHKKM